MTAIVGVACTDGVVIGADSSATMGMAPNVHTIEQPTDKIQIIRDQVIVAGTGAVGLGQRFGAVVERLWSDGAAKKGGAIEAGKLFSAQGIEDFASTHIRPGALGALVAFPCGGKACLCELALADFQPELKDDRFWYVSLGSAQPITDPFLGFIREVFWDDGQPSLAEGIFAVTWTLEQAIALNPGGVNGPIRLAVLQRKGGKEFHARCLDETELEIHRENVQAAKAHLRSFRSQHSPQAAEQLPIPPTM